MIIFLDAIYTIGFVQTINFDFDVFIFKTDLVGNKIWEKSYGVSAWDENAKSAIINDTTLTILSSETFDPNDNVYNDEDTWNKIFSIDSSGVVKSTWRTMNGEEGFSAQSLIKIRSDYYYTTHPGVQLSFNTLHYAPEIVCRDSLFNLKWKRTYGDTFYLNWFSNIVVGQDNFLYAAGYIPDGVTWGRVCKINPENGDLIWEARDTAFYIPGWGSRNRLEGLTVLPGGSVIAVGYTVDYTYHENGLLYKVTADGCIDTLCNTVGIQEYIYNQQHKVKVYPNPAVDEINFDVSEIEVNFLDIFNLQGQLIMRNEVHTGLNKIQIDQESLKPGIYFWLFTGDKGEVVETGKVIIGLP
ncbi:MAG TPA: T9SS type A sorting domain-containing protein [Saprospiraceae bacterium]|nr:T9SS type A sorting domain-containing protein [Saprospiraceae bacterium]